MSALTRAVTGLALEPLVPGRRDRNAGTASTEKRLAEVTVSFVIDVNADAQQALRESLARMSELYRRTWDGLVSPRSPEGQLSRLRYVPIAGMPVRFQGVS